MLSSNSIVLEAEPAFQRTRFLKMAGMMLAMLAFFGLVHLVEDVQGGKPLGSAIGLFLIVTLLAGGLVSLIAKSGAVGLVDRPRTRRNDPDQSTHLGADDPHRAGRCDPLHAITEWKDVVASEPQDAIAVRANPARRISHAAGQLELDHSRDGGRIVRRPNENHLCTKLHGVALNPLNTMFDPTAIG
ncbi:MAG TPA: hypothetical protein VMU84_10905 [Thermoanaerobaculia bacterium]|nr:hypothetical protein [Thermoanaerobaculia bacterium]